MDQRAVLQLAVLASLATISAFVAISLYRKRNHHQHLKDVKRSHVTDTASKSKVAQQQTQQKFPVTQNVDAKPITNTNIGEYEASLATKKYKAGEYDDAVQLYSVAISLCEQQQPLDVRNLKVMYSNRAAAYEKLVNFENVVKDCTSALQLDKRHPKSYLRRAKARASTGDLRGALVDYVCLLVIAEEKQEQVDENLAQEISRIHSEITAREIEDAQQNIQKPMRYLPDQFFITSYFSSFHPSDDENDILAEKSSKEYTAELESIADEGDYRRQRGLLLTKRGLSLKKEKEYDMAAKDFDAACKLVQFDDEAFYTAQIENGTYHHLRGEFEFARESFEKALASKPHSIFAKIRMGGLCFDQKDLKKALEWFDKALKEKSECSTAFFHRGQLHSIDLQPDGSSNGSSMTAALKDLEKCISIAPDFAMAYIQLGVTHARNGNFQGAVEYLTTAARITPEIPEIYNYLGETYMQMLQIPGSSVDMKTVEQMFEKAIELDPSYPMAYINQGNLVVQKGSEYGHQALALFEKAVEMCPRSKFAYCHLAQVYMAMQEYSRAIEQIDKAVLFAFSKDELNELFAIRVTAETHQQAAKLLQ
ncbi:Translocase of outer mitochondrial membrane complex, subunit TOM70/TOM72 [Plasmopara halstedii]|uniref:Translocase of outer mitochondrial membrane complex, subunit TOM70/TOM72 n=1 Tax=Plasmopara halstedii TaxID=4781 RepID=A0A0N7L6B3_PLAHL|nr:Translocase of outer mitochondrial membrane complex, subunit TOM70/TOM72 [Plasmopara halstedii]CEG43795.1 Translocase of outer mitochondrial membrane complex, subunit TOM70/TOM72 [Plasmopara halstedii]|eukprot:XP_024580164.1 Translocase of outer mitochondrial membrane complex, subunit TOM70/TOM72 [Plasmopara halstedii]